MLLSIASGNTFLESAGGSAPSDVSTVSPDIVAVAKQAFYDFGERPMWSERITYGTGEQSVDIDHELLLTLVTADTQGRAVFSGRREGFSLYFSRLVRPFWKCNLTKQG
jgi:nuclear pore complex protein Nup155